ncbi:DUF6264 family protein [Microbacterium sp. G2-8]|uniref:DUF6264 family protein n=1 Tax=Microbacterium sp. G2-8 TaxID=2842454 RepID=UPI001C89A362|nr:DUF6264 family protein [Microbacterium sp. G2-8]
MTDGSAPDRPRPQYGQYATPDEQRARGGQTVEPVEPIDPALIPQDTPIEVAPPRASGPRLADRIVTIALLAYGLFNTLSAIPMFTDPTALLDIMGVDAEVADYAGQRTAGVVAIAVMILGWLATTWLVWRRGSAGKSMWWIALLAGIVFNTIASLMIAIPLVQDPNVFEALMQMQGIAP